MIGLFGTKSQMQRSANGTSGRLGTLETRLTKVESDQRELRSCDGETLTPQFYPKLRKLEGADFDSPFNFAWSIDFPKRFLAITAASTS